MKKYKRFKEFTTVSSLSKLTKVELVEPLYNYFYEHPYPEDHEGIHKFAESLGIKPDELEIYIYAMLSCIICGGKSFKKDLSSIDPVEREKGFTVEAEHVDVWTDNKVVQKIAELFRYKIEADHNVERKDYYAFGQSFGIFDELE